MDFATILSPDLIFDWAIVNGDLAVDDGLDTAVMISLWSDRLANPDDELPDNSGDRRGWGGDIYLPRLKDGTQDHLGSRLWLLARAKQIRETALRAQTYCQEALQWLVDDGLAAAVTTPLPSFPRLGAIEIVNSISQKKPRGLIDRRYTSLWDMTRGTVSFSGIALGGF